MKEIILIDANLLVLLIVGLTNIKYIKIHKKCSQFTIVDFQLLESILNNASGVVTTNNALTEASNLLGYINDPAKSKIFETFYRFIQINKEIYVPSKRASAQKHFIRLGLTDAAFLEAGETSMQLLTTDLDLVTAATKAGQNALNFTHYMEANKSE